MSDFRPDIWRLQAQFNTEGLVEALKDDDAGIRRRAAAALRALGAFDAIPNLETALEEETDTEARANIVSALAALQHEKERQHAGPEAETQPQPPLSETDILIRQLQSKDPEEVIAAAQRLGEMDDKLAVPALVLLFNKPDIFIKVRLAVAEALLKLESAPVEVALLGALRNTDARIRRNGAAILGQLRANWAVDPLARALYDEHEHVRKTAYAALKSIGTEEALNALAAVREDIRNKKRTTSEMRVTQVSDENDDDDHDETKPSKSDMPQLREEAAPGASTNADADHSALLDVDDDGNPLGVEDTQKIVWPTKRKKEEDMNPTLAPTKPFDPKTIERAREQMERLRSEQKKPDDEL